MFTDKVRIHWDNASAPGGWCMPAPGAHHQYPLEATLKIDADQVWWTTESGRVTTVPKSLIFGATRVARPLPAAKTLKSTTVLSQNLYNTADAAVFNIENSPYWILHAVELKQGRTDKQPGIRRILFESQDVGAKACTDAVVDCAGIGQTVRSVLVLLNPFSGTKRGKQYYRTVVKPMFDIAGITVHLQETTHINHAAEITRSINLNLYSAVVTIGGDGVFHEAINGLLTRPDWEEARRVPVGFIGGGSANAMNKNLMTQSRELATLTVIKGQTRPLDIFSVSQNDTVVYSHLAVMWTLLADLDFESERYRWMGGERMTVAAIIRLIRLRTYRGKLYLLPTSQADAYDESATPRTPGGQHGPARRFTASPTAHLAWPRKLDTTFNYFVATNLPWVSDQFMAAPASRLADGTLHVVWSEGMTLVQALASLIDQGSGNYLTSPVMNVERVKAFVIDPHGWSWDKKGLKDVHAGKYMDVSGEQVSYLPTRVEVHPAIMNVLAPDWLDEEEWTRIAEKAKRAK
ncbi:ATP-NAD kinase-like domain-containing protein [Geranomyces variabilis]|nr:ATP-NAD kinase-like domain-containing protein [Geranomyces variabilis]KAJ3136606.1 hypothetical protein HDU90_002982 [Geranomyces variabilis]